MATEFEGFAIVELMGHRRLAGYVREVTVAGAPLLRLDVPSDPPVTQYYGASAIYCITPTTEELAKQVAQQSRPAPVSRYELPEPRKPAVDDEFDDSERDYDPDEDRSVDDGGI
ncbi:MAG: acetyltransferase [Kofleriaceae bacterium]